MALKVVPAGDERCDIHNHRAREKYVCETCLKEFGIEADEPASAGGGRRRRRHRRGLRRWLPDVGPWTLIGAGIAAVLIAAVAAVAILAGGGDDEGGPTTEEDVVNGIDLLPNPAGSGWITSDGACAVVSIDLGREAQSGAQGQDLSVEATNEDRTVRLLVVPNDFSLSQTECVGQVETALRDEF